MDEVEQPPLRNPADLERLRNNLALIGRLIPHVQMRHCF